MAVGPGGCERTTTRTRVEHLALPNDYGGRQGVTIGTLAGDSEQAGSRPTAVYGAGASLEGS